MVGNPEDFNTFVTDAERKGWGPGILSICNYNPHVNGVFDVLTPTQKGSCGNRTGRDLSIILGG
jgi:hypothetical protein